MIEVGITNSDPVILEIWASIIGSVTYGGLINPTVTQQR